MGVLFRIQRGHELFRTFLERFRERVAIRHQGGNLGLEGNQSLLKGEAIDHLRPVVAGKKRDIVWQHLLAARHSHGVRRSESDGTLPPRTGTFAA